MNGFSGRSISRNGITQEAQNPNLSVVTNARSRRSRSEIRRNHSNFSETIESPVAGTIFKGEGGWTTWHTQSRMLPYEVRSRGARAITNESGHGDEGNRYHTRRQFYPNREVLEFPNFNDDFGRLGNILEAYAQMRSERRERERISRTRRSQWAYHQNGRPNSRRSHRPQQEENLTDVEIQQLVDNLRAVNLRYWGDELPELQRPTDNRNSSTEHSDETVFEENGRDDEDFQSIADALCEAEMLLIPLTKVRQHHVISEIVCPTCMEDFILEEEVRQLSCDHIFHSKCIFPWLARNKTCPVCRGIVDPANYPQLIQ